MTRFLPAFLRRWLHWCLNFTPLVREPVSRLKIIQDIQPVESGDYHWRAVGSGPQFLWRERLPAPGWYMLEVQLRHDQPLAGLRVYFDRGPGLDEEGSFYLPLKAGRLTKRLCLVPRGLKSVRIDPMESAGRFSFDRLRFARISDFMAMNRLVQRLCNMHHHWKDVPAGEVLSRIQIEAEAGRGDTLALATKYYEETFARMGVAWSYPEWVARNPSLTSEAMTGAKAVTRWIVIVPLVRPSLEHLNVSLDSIQAQGFEGWQLFFLLGPGLSEEVRALVDALEQSDDRVQVVPSDQWKKLNLTVEKIAAKTEGTDPTAWLGILEPGEALAPDAFWWLNDYVCQHPEVGILYSDEDRLDTHSGRFAPQFKPDWNPDLLLSGPYTGKAVWARADLLSLIGCIQGQSADVCKYEWLLEFGLTRSMTVGHLAKVLYHGFSVDPDQSRYSEAALEVLAAWLKRNKPGATAERQGVSIGFRVIHALPDPAPFVSLLIPTRNGVDILQPCVDAILDRTDYSRFEVLILDNQSDCQRTLEYMARVAEDPRVRVLHWDHPFNYSAINNFGAKAALGDIIGLVNNDIEPISAGWLTEMVRQAARPEIGCVGAKLYYPNDTIQHGGVILGIGGVAGHSHKYLTRDDDGYQGRLKQVQNLSAVTGACLLLRRSVFEAVGGLEEANLKVAFNDVDLCLRVRDAGYRNLWTPYAEAYHHESVSRGADNTPEKRERANREAEYMRKRWGAALDSDPAYNPNLTLIHEDFSLR